MAELILLIFFCSFFCFGFNYATLYTPRFELMTNAKVEIKPNDVEILWFIRYYGNKWLPKYLTKPLYGCLMCMSSCWASLFYWGHVLNSPGRINGLTIILWLVVVTAVAGLNRILKQIAQL